MLHAGLDLSRRRLDVCLLNDVGEVAAQTAAAPDADGLRHLVMRVGAGRVRAVIESMNGARFVHDTLEELGWEVLIADAQKVKGLAPLACKTDKIDAHGPGGALLARSGAGDLAARPDDPPRARARAVPVASGPPPQHAQEPHPRDADHLRPSVPGLGPVRARRPRAARPPRDPRAVAAQRRRQPGLIDDLELQIANLTCELKRQGADHRYIPLLVTAPGFGWINAYTVASEIGDITRFPSPAKLVGYTGLCPRVIQSGGTDRRGPITKHGPRYLRWGLFEAAMNACKHPLYAEHYQHTKRRLGRQRGPKVAQIELSRKLTEAIWHMLTRNQPFAPAGAGFRLAA